MLPRWRKTETVKGRRWICDWKVAEALRESKCGWVDTYGTIDHMGMHAYSPGILTLSTHQDFDRYPNSDLMVTSVQQRQVSNSTLLCRQDMFISYIIYRLLRFSGHARIHNCTIYIILYLYLHRASLGESPRKPEWPPGSSFFRRFWGWTSCPASRSKPLLRADFSIWEPWWWVNIPKQHRTSVAHRGAITSP